MNDDVKSLGCKVRTVGDDKVSITHWSDGSKRITLSRRQKHIKGGKVIFEVVEVVDVPPAFVDFVSDALGLVKSTDGRTALVQDFARGFAASVARGDPWDAAELRAQFRELLGAMGYR
jgi:hypothetical protein